MRDIARDLPARSRQRSRAPQRPRRSIHLYKIHGAPRRSGVDPSVGSVGDIYDNALAETINGLFEAEVIWRRGPWRNFEAFEFATLEWVDRFNNRRLRGPIRTSPAEAEARYYAELEEAAIAA
ncbi:hypothetical protein Ms3S1_p10480 (plasmid) [Methylosinus sp. 3S-1]